jgi:hypothetical protein
LCLRGNHNDTFNDDGYNRNCFLSLVRSLEALVMAFKPTAAQIKIMRHALGFENGETEYRNHYCAAEGHSAWEDLLILEKELFMRRVHSPVELDKQATFMVTNEGKPWCQKTRKVK